MKILIIICLLIFSTNSYSTELNCATNDFPPFGFNKSVVDKKGKEVKTFTGIETELFYQICKELNIKCKLEELPWKRMIENMKSGAIDCMFAAFDTEERREFMTYTTVPFHVSNLVFFINSKNKKFKFNSYDDLKGLVIGLTRGFATTPEFDQHVKDGLFKVKELNGFDQALKMVSVNRIDATIINKEVGLALLKKEKIKNISIYKNPLLSNPAYLTFTKKKDFKDLPSKVSDKIFYLLKEGSYQKIYKKFVD